MNFRRAHYGLPGRALTTAESLHDFWMTFLSRVLAPSASEKYIRCSEEGNNARLKKGFFHIQFVSLLEGLLCNGWGFLYGV